MELLEGVGEVVVRVESEEVKWACPECGGRMSVNGRVKRRWRHLDRGHDYVTVVTRVPEEGAPFVDYIAEGREKAALDAYWGLPATGPLGDIRCASMDMWRPYISSAAGALPGGAGAITHDPFHLVQCVNKALEAVRRQEQPLLPPGQREEMKGMRYAWLYGFESLPEKWSQRLAALKDGQTRTALAWRLKEGFRAFYQCANWTQAAAYFEDWWQSVQQSGLEPMIKAAQCIRNHLPQVLNYFVHKVTNAFSEGINSIIAHLITRARGYRSKPRLKRDLFFHLGNLDLLPTIP